MVNLSMSDIYNGGVNSYELKYVVGKGMSNMLVFVIPMSSKLQTRGIFRTRITLFLPGILNTGRVIVYDAG